MRKIVVENSHLVNLANNPDAVAKFPFLERLRDLLKKGGGGGCGCGGQANVHQQNVAAAQVSVRQSIKGLSSDRLQELKSLMGADSLVIYGKNASGVLEEVVL